jgi:hypothetical protein
MLLNRRADFYSGAHPVAADTVMPQAFPDIKITVRELFG